MLANGSLVWFDHEHETWSPARVVSVTGGSVRVRMEGEGGGEFTTAADCAMPMNKQNLSAAPDMVKLGDLHEAALLHNLRLRFSTDDIFTYIGPILVACNPYKPLQIFTREYTERYHAAGPGEVLPPHVYGLANNAYGSMLRDRADQSVVISGESGAGKTEETKLCVQFLADVAGSEDGADGRRPEQLLLASSPILEAMGNAKTTRNNNSSRFGKYMQICFDGRGRITGGLIIKYLLEKVRVVAPAAGERNFHMFYLLHCVAPEEREPLGLGELGGFLSGRFFLAVSSVFGDVFPEPRCARSSASVRAAEMHTDEEDTAPTDVAGDPQRLRYCGGGGCTTVEGLDDEADLAEFRAAWERVGVRPAELGAMYRVVGGVMHLGNVSFQEGAGATEGWRDGPAQAAARVRVSRARAWRRWRRRRRCSTPRARRCGRR
jgi:myosin heavy subunit